MIVTAEMLAELQKGRQETQGRLDQAKGRMSVIEQQMAVQIEEMAKLGVTPETAPTRIDDLNQEIETLYTKATGILEEINNATRGQN